MFRLGLPGVGFLPEHKRVYPNGPVAAHVLGFTNIDNIGIAGMEKYIDSLGFADLSSAGFKVASQDMKPIKLSIDLKATHAVRDELVKGIERYKAKAAAAAIMDVNTGEIIAIASLPDYDPNNPVDALEPTRINRMIVGVFEMGSTFKALTLAMSLDSRKATLQSKVDARAALRYGRHTINDFHGQHRTLSFSEVFTYSSNIGTARLALGVGVEGHQQFLRKMGQLDRMRTEMPESAEPIVPRRWGELNTMTIAFGHGLAVAPLQSMMAVSALMNGGKLDQADLPHAHDRGGAGECAAGDQARNQRADALSHAAQRGSRLGAQDRHAGLFRRRQDRHRQQGGQRPLFQRSRVHDVHGHRALRQAEISLPHRVRRTAGRARNIWPAHGRVERGRNDGPHHRARDADPRLAAAPADSRTAASPRSRALATAFPAAGATGVDHAPRASAATPSCRRTLAARRARGLAEDSRNVQPGFVFFALSGAKADGLSFAPHRACRRRVRHRLRARAAGRRQVHLHRGCRRARSRWRRPRPSSIRASPP